MRSQKTGFAINMPRQNRYPQPKNSGRNEPNSTVTSTMAGPSTSSTANAHVAGTTENYTYKSEEYPPLPSAQNPIPQARGNGAPSQPQETNMSTDTYLLGGLASKIREASHKQDTGTSSLVLGIDIGSLGIDMSSKAPLYTTFESPFRPEDLQQLSDIPQAASPQQRQSGLSGAPPSQPQQSCRSGAPPSQPQQSGRSGAPPSQPQQPGFTPAPPSQPQQPGFPPAPPSQPQQPGFPPAPPQPQQPGFPLAPPSQPQQPGFPPAPPSQPQQPGFTPAPPSQPQQPGFTPASPSQPQQPGFPPAQQQ